MRTKQAIPSIGIKQPHFGAKIPAKTLVQPQSRVQKARRYRPGTVALREIRKYQNTVCLTFICSLC